MKTKKSMKNRTCYQCDGDICKGEQYGQRSISAGKTCSWTADQRPTEEIPAWAWSDYRVKVVICNKCANPSMFAASPDGLTEDGMVIEFKAKCSN